MKPGDCSERVWRTLQPWQFTPKEIEAIQKARSEGKTKRKLPIRPLNQERLGEIADRSTYDHNHDDGWDESTEGMAMNVDDPHGTLDGVDWLELWKSKCKATWVQVEIDNGYGAACWFVTLGFGKRKVVASEVRFVAPREGDAFADYQDDEGNLYTTAVDSEDDEFPGLDKTIICAWFAANKHFGDELAKLTNT